MHPSATKNQPKKATNLSINKELLTEARKLNINLSATLEHALGERVREEKRKQWVAENRAAIKACNDLVEKNGLFSDKYRAF